MQAGERRIDGSLITASVPQSRTLRHNLRSVLFALALLSGLSEAFALSIGRPDRAGASLPTPTTSVVFPVRSLEVSVGVQILEILDVGLP